MSSITGTEPFTGTPSSRWERVLELVRRHPRRSDALLAAVYSVMMLLSIWVGSQLIDPSLNVTSPLWASALAVSAMVLVAWRRQYPEAQFVASGALYIGATFGPTFDGIVGLVWAWFGFYGVGCYGGRFRHPVRALMTIALGLTVIFSPDGQSTDASATAIRGPEIAFVSVFFFGFVASAWLAGDTTRIRRLQASALFDRTRELEAERDLNAERAVTDERLRIARELHDVMAHHVTIIGIQASAAERILDRDVVKARTALQLISRESRETVDELQRLLGFLRPARAVDSAFEADPPQPSVANVARLVADSRASGLEVSLETTGDLENLPGSVSLSAYRIVQEALTNVRKHAGSSRANVRVDVAAGWVNLKVHNVRGNPSLAGQSTGSGLGLLGMRERARLVGGEVKAGPSSEGGWLVEARLPVQAVPL
jgi:signal transduction histidine kinase